MIDPLLKLMFEIELSLQKAWLLLRCILGAHGFAGGYSSSTLAFLHWLQHHVEDTPRGDAGTEVAGSKVAVQLADFLNRHLPVSPSRPKVSISSLEVKMWLSKIDTYAFSCSSGDLAGGTHVAGGALFRYASFFNHSCCPNAVTRWDARRGEIIVTAIQHIKSGDEVTISYLPHSCDSWCCQGRGSEDNDRRTSIVNAGFRHYPRMILAERRETLLASKHFYCKCHRCMEEEGMPLNKPPPTYEDHTMVMSWKFRDLGR